MQTIKGRETFKFIRTEQYKIDEIETEAYISWDEFRDCWVVNTPRQEIEMKHKDKF